MVGELNVSRHKPGRYVTKCCTNVKERSRPYSYMIVLLGGTTSWTSKVNSIHWNSTIENQRKILRNIFKIGAFAFFSQNVECVSLSFLISVHSCYNWKLISLLFIDYKLKLSCCKFGTFWKFKVWENVSKKIWDFTHRLPCFAFQIEQKS